MADASSTAGRLAVALLRGDGLCCTWVLPEVYGSTGEAEGRWRSGKGGYGKGTRSLRYWAAIWAQILQEFSHPRHSWATAYGIPAFDGLTSFWTSGSVEGEPLGNYGIELCSAVWNWTDLVVIYIYIYIWSPPPNGPTAGLDLCKSTANTDKTYAVW